MKNSRNPPPVYAHYSKRDNCRLPNKTNKNSDGREVAGTIMKSGNFDAAACHIQEADAIARETRSAIAALILTAEAAQRPALDMLFERAGDISQEMEMAMLALEEQMPQEERRLALVQATA